MAFDAHQNLAVATIAIAPSPATTGTSLTVATGEGARFPAAPFNATVRPSSAIPTPVNAEIVRVTAVATNTLTIIRAQEGTVARAIVPGDVIAETITAKTLTDIESGSFPTVQTVRVSPGTLDGADTSALQVAGGGVGFWDRGAFINLYGNEHGGLGSLGFYTGDHPQAGITFNIASNERGRIHHSGGFSWGGTTDPGAGSIIVGAGGQTLGTAFAVINPGDIALGGVGTGTNYPMGFRNASGTVGYISTSGTTTTYSTTSDARLKTDRGRLTDTTVLSRTVIHDFVWNTDGQLGRGVFAQEAAAVAPFAVTVGTDERDEEGRLTHPWGVDYSKYVPDLIVGWQQHDAELVALRAEVAALQATAMRVLPTPHYGTTDPRPSNRGAAWFSRVRDRIAAWWSQKVATS